MPRKGVFFPPFQRELFLTMRRAFAGFCAFAVAALLSQGAWAAKKASPPRAAAAGDHGPYIVADADSGRVIEEFDALRPWYPASTTKLMTIYVVFRAMEAGEIRLDSEILYSSRAAAAPPRRWASSRAPASGSTMR